MYFVLFLLVIIERKLHEIFLSLSVGSDGNCLFHAVSIGVIGSEEMSNELRLLTAIELYENADFYGNHPHFDTVLSTMVGYSTTVNNLFTQSLSDAGCKVYTKIKCRSMAVKEEAEYVYWSSFICVMALCSVLDAKHYARGKT